MSDDLVAVPRAAVEALVDPEHMGYMYRDGECCSYCNYTLKTNKHDLDCPVRIVQEALARPQAESIEHLLFLCVDRLMAFRGDLPDLGIREDFNDSLIERGQKALNWEARWKKQEEIP